MAISLNANLANLAAGGRLALGNGVTGTPPAPGPTVVPPPPAAPTPARPPAPVLPPSAFPITPVAVGPVLQPPVLRPPIIPPILQPPITLVPPPQNKTATQLARGAIAQLSAAAPASINTALNAVRSRSLDGPGLIPYLERKVRIGEVLNELAKDWSAPTRSDFAAAFNMDAANLNDEVLDSIVSVAILNDKEVPSEILGENTPQTTPTDLMDNRRIVWQSVPPGTVLNPPYVVLVAVEYEEVATAQDVLNGIMNQLGTTAAGFKVPRTAIQKGVN